MNEEVLNQEGLNEELRTYIESNIQKDETIEPAEEVSILEDNSVEEIVEEPIEEVVTDENEVVDSEVGLTEDDIILEEVEDESELND